MAVKRAAEEASNPVRHPPCCAAVAATRGEVVFLWRFNRWRQPGNRREVREKVIAWREGVIYNGGARGRLRKEAFGL